MSFIPREPLNFRVTSIQILPPSRIDLAWDAYDNADLLDDILHFNVEDQLFATINTNPDRLFAHNRSLIGYELYRNEGSDFDPLNGEGILLADETTLDALSTTYTDTLNIQPNTVYFYKLTAKIAE